MQGLPLAKIHVAPSLVFIHGLGGHPQSTWSMEPCDPNVSAKRVTNLSRFTNKLLGIPQRISGLARFRKANEDAKGDNESTSGVSTRSMAKEIFWPQDLLPKDIKDVRVMTYGYYSSPGNSCQDNLYTLSKNLLIRLTNERADMVGQS